MGVGGCLGSLDDLPWKLVALLMDADHSRIENLRIREQELLKLSRRYLGPLVFDELL